MASTSFVLKDKNTKGKTPIFLLFRYNSQRIKISTREMVEPEYWNARKQRVIVTSELHNSQEINNVLTVLQDNSLEIYDNFKNEFNREPKTEELKVLFDKSLFLDDILVHKSSQQLTFFEFFENLIKVRKENKKVSPQRVYIYNNALNLLRDFQKDTGELVAFERFDEHFSINFRAYLEQKKQYSPNTILKNFKVIRTVLNNAFTKNYNINREYKSLDFMPEEEETFEIALSIDEVEALYKHDFSKNKKLDKIRDLFVVQCYSGLRFSDLRKLGKEHLQGKFLSIVQEKTKKKNPLPVIIPILEPVKEIFEKYNYKLPNDVTNQYMNSMLKEMAKDSKLFDDEVSYYKIKAGERRLISNPRFNEITTHTARRTYCTMSYKIGVPTQSIMRISGHKTEASFLRYLKVNNEEHAERTLKIWEAYYLNVKNDTGKTIQLLKEA